MKVLRMAWDWYCSLGEKTPKELVLQDLLEAQRLLLQCEKEREEANARVTLLRSRISRLQSHDAALD